jgi:hypothetical protein
MKPTYFDISSPNATRLPMTSIPSWDDDGVLILEKFLPDDLIDAYIAERVALIGKTPKWRPGWNDAVPYLRVPSMRSLALHRPLTEAIRPLIGSHEPGLHLCLTGFQSTERAWHQDRYLNPEYVGERYIAAWLVLEDVHPDAGPFEYIPGSHRWPVIEREKVWSKMKQLGQDPTLPTWPSDSQVWLGEVCEDEIRNRKAPVKQFLGKRGDVLLWHASLVHRGSKPKNPLLERRALISHYSSIHARPDMTEQRRLENGSFYFHFDHGLTEPLESTHQSKNGGM